eukprot:4761476-Pleurochrysis_carterae.AAC.1
MLLCLEARHKGGAIARDGALSRSCAPAQESSARMRSAATGDQGTREEVTIPNASARARKCPDAARDSSLRAAASSK